MQDNQEVMALKDSANQEVMALKATVARQQMQIADLSIQLEVCDAERSDLLRRSRVRPICEPLAFAMCIVTGPQAAVFLLAVPGLLLIGLLCWRRVDRMQK